MNDTVESAIDREIALLTRVQDPAVPPLGYGVDLSCVTDCTPMLAEVDPFSFVAVGEALLRRLITVRGSVDDDKDYGLDLRSYLNRGVSESELRKLAGRVEGECRKDDRVVAVEATVAVEGRRTLRVSLVVTPEVAYGQTFNLVFSVTDSQVLIDTLAQ